ncbi:MAG: spore cortex biosynthesis protein YabQ [Clostridia bacterium]|nr:spore cortex biosynthesis protein YabQ [Clostridia bacterium]
MAFLIDICAGLLVGFGYDFFGALRHQIDKKKPNAFLDFLFWLFAGGVILTAFFYNSDLKLRAYEFFGILTGIFFYFSVLSNLFIPLHEKIADIFQFFYRILFTSVKWFVIIIKNGLLFLCFPFCRLLHYFKKRLTKLGAILKKHRKLIKRI